jgi:predicted ATPase
MVPKLSQLKVRNYRCLADLTLDLRGVNVFFGPNGSGKSTILDTIWFFRDCAIRGVEIASGARSHGIGLLWDGAAEGDQITVNLGTQSLEYELRFGLSSGRIEQSAGEKLQSHSRGLLIDRNAGSDKASLFHEMVGSSVPVPLREPDKLSLGVYLDFNARDAESTDLDRLLRHVRRYHSRSMFVYRLKQQGSEGSYETRLWDLGDNLWSVLRNLHDRKAVDDRFETIMKYMAESFPSFAGIRLEQTGPNTVYAHFHENGRRKEIYASGVSDGYLQQLLLLTALFSEGRDPALLLIDEPEVSLHPWPLAVFANAVQEASQDWNKQILIATHSPPLLSQFLSEQILVTEVVDGRTHVKRLSDMDQIKDLLDQYATGSLYMAEVVGGQKPSVVQSVEN